jgi:hypothetical protein
MIAEYLHQCSAPHALHPRHSRLVQKSFKDSVVRFCLTRQHDKTPATMFDIIDFLSAQRVTVDRFWVRNFAQWQKQRLCLHTAKVLERDLHDVSPDDIR